MKTIGLKVAGVVLLLAGASGVAPAQQPQCGGFEQPPCPENQVPEVDANVAASAIALISGTLLVLKSRKKPQ
jgi:hypothetical protein